MPKAPAAPKTLAARVYPTATDAQKETLRIYTDAVQDMQMGDFRKALDGFRLLDGDAPPEVRERAHVYQQACERQIHQQETRLEFHTPIEQYDYAIACMNNSDYEEARDHFQAILEYDDNADYAHYGIAMLHGITGQADACLHHLARAIDLKPFNRVHARNDTDFRPMADDPRFTELLYPEAI